MSAAEDLILSNSILRQDPCRSPKKRAKRAKVKRSFWVRWVGWHLDLGSSAQLFIHTPKLSNGFDFMACRAIKVTNCYRFLNIHTEVQTGSKSQTSHCKRNKCNRVIDRNRQWMVSFPQHAASYFNSGWNLQHLITSEPSLTQLG